MDTGRWWVGCYIWYSEEEPGRAAAPPSPLLAVLNVTAHPLTASVPITVLLYDGQLLGGFNVAIKWLNGTVSMAYSLSVDGVGAVKWVCWIKTGNIVKSEIQYNGRRHGWISWKVK